MSSPSVHGLVERLDEMAYLEGCRPWTAHCVLKTDDDGVEASDGRLYCRRCCWDVRGTPMPVMMDREEDACHCESCGCLLAYTLSPEAARRFAGILSGATAGLHCDDRYHVARMLEAYPGGEVLEVAIATVGDDHGV